jgi:hypothetical protein
MSTSLSVMQKGSASSSAVRQWTVGRICEVASPCSAHADDDTGRAETYDGDLLAAHAAPAQLAVRHVELQLDVDKSARARARVKSK